MPEELIYGPLFLVGGVPMFVIGLCAFGYASDHPDDILSGPLNIVGSIIAIIGAILMLFGFLTSLPWIGLLMMVGFVLAVVYVCVILLWRVARHCWRLIVVR